MVINQVNVDLYQVNVDLYQVNVELTRFSPHSRWS